MTDQNGLSAFEIACKASKMFNDSVAEVYKTLPEGRELVYTKLMTSLVKTFGNMIVFLESTPPAPFGGNRHHAGGLLELPQALLYSVDEVNGCISIHTWYLVVNENGTTNRLYAT